jgi:hypothetical protein
MMISIPIHVDLPDGDYSSFHPVMCMREDGTYYPRRTKYMDMGTRERKEVNEKERQVRQAKLDRFRSLAETQTPLFGD